MTEEKKILLGGLKERVGQLMTICNRTKEENYALREKNEELQNKLNAMDADCKELKRKYENLRTALSLMDGSEVHDTKIKLNRIVRDIEKCMTLLNN